ncbi:MAG: sulfur carrier protein ThiS [Phycisphaeraceae bacterium]|nr:sulfur carrier protein ThiS [Phycisphaeraceae bacterium]MCW5762317.1 sulfur carrier protein ThiS [Phycisphaeraceae bacterium]
MRITVNGEPVDLPEGVTVAELIAQIGLSTTICAAEVNRNLVPKRDQDTRELRDGDAVEIVTLVGGG